MTKPSTLQDRAMLATLNISQWTNRKHDKSISEEVEKQHGATDAGRYNKLLVHKSSLEPINKIASACRIYHYKMTLPWGDNGDRLLPGALFTEYAKEIRGYKDQFHNAAAAFVVRFPSLVSEARTRLGSMYEASDYPDVSEMRARFAIETSFSSVASAGDFRVELNEEYVNSIKREITERTENLQKDAVRHCWGRVRTVVSNIHERLADKDNKFKDSLIENARELIAILPALNITGDSELIAIETDVKALLLPPDRLRSDNTLRSETAQKAADILAKMTGRSMQVLELVS